MWRPTSGDELRARCSVLLCLDYVSRLRALLAFGDFELNLVTLLQAFVTLSGNRAVMHKYIRSICATNEPVPFSIVEPLHYAFHPIHEIAPFLHVLNWGPGTCPQYLDAFWSGAVTLSREWDM